jgi:excisionase family DNA binding protein
MSESDMIRGFFKEFLKPIIAEAIAEATTQTNGNTTKRYYTREEACEHLKIGTTTFYRLAKKGKIEILKIGGKTLVDADALDEAIENQEVMRYGR